MKTIAKSAANLFLFLGLAGFIHAQGSDAGIAGTVSDALGTPIPAASITVRNLETGAERKLTTDDAGRYAAPALAIGTYRVTASKEGFQSSSKTGVTLAVGQRAELAFQLPVCEVKESMSA